LRGTGRHGQSGRSASDNTDVEVIVRHLQSPSCVEIIADQLPRQTYWRIGRYFAEKLTATGMIGRDPRPDDRAGGIVMRILSGDVKKAGDAGTLYFLKSSRFAFSAAPGAKSSHGRQSTVPSFR
jgi:hypothetical protein